MVDLKSVLWLCKSGRLKVLCWNLSCHLVLTEACSQGKSCKMAILFFQISAPSLQHLPSYVHSSVLSGKKRKKFFFGPELNLLSVGNLGSIEVCSTVPETKDFFLSNIWKNGCPERLSHFLNITELVSKCQVQAQTQAAAPHVQALSQVSGCRFEPRNNPPVWAQFHFGMAGVRPVNWSCYSHKAELSSFLAALGEFSPLSIRIPGWAPCKTWNQQAML